jgi:hypothetical protein
MPDYRCPECRQSPCVCEDLTEEDDWDDDRTPDWRGQYPPPRDERYERGDAD